MIRKPTRESTRSGLLVLTMAFMAALQLMAGPSPTHARLQHEDQEQEAHRLVTVGAGKARPMEVSWSGPHTYLGVNLVDLTPELLTHFGVAGDAGVMVSKVHEESPASRVAIRVGDIITAIDGVPVVHSFELVHRIGRQQDGDSVELEIWRGGELLRLTPVLEERERPRLDVRRLVPFGQGPHGHEILAPGELEEIIEIDPSTLDEAMEQLNEQLASPRFHQRIEEYWTGRSALRERLEKLEERLKELEKELAELSPGDS